METKMQPRSKPITFSLFCLLGIVLFTLTATSISYCSEWTLSKRTSIKRAVINNKNHGSLQIQHRQGEGIYIFFYIRNKKVSFRNNLPLYQVDDGKVHHLDNVSELYTGKKRWIKWLLTDDIKNFGSDLNEIINGKKLYFQYYLPDKTIKEAVFELQGAKTAVNEIVR